jgi:hypothetical protein
MATYICFNGPMNTTAAPVSVTTGSVIKTLLQLKPAANIDLKIIEWGISFDGSAAATPGKVELIDTGTVSGSVTAFAAADIMPFNDANAAANTAGTSGVPLNLGVAASGYTCTSEQAITATRMLDLQLIAPTGQYIHQFPLGERPSVKAGNILRVRTTFGTAINAYTYIVFGT